MINDIAQPQEHIRIINQTAGIAVILLYEISIQKTIQNFIGRHYDFNIFYFFIKNILLMHQNYNFVAFTQIFLLI